MQELETGGHIAALSYVGEHAIRAHGFSEDELARIVETRELVGNSTSLGDCSVLFLAEKLEAKLLTNDGALRKAASARALRVHGTLWIFDQLVEKGLLAPGQAARRLEKLLGLDRFLPKWECERRLRKWPTAE